MKYLLYVVTLLLSVQYSWAQQAVQDSSIYISSSQLYRMGESLIVSMKVDISRQVPSNESIELIPQLSDSLDNFFELPSIYINGRRQHIFLQRQHVDRDKDCEMLRRRNKEKQTVQYLRSIPFSNWMRRASLYLVEKDCGCGVPRRTDSTYLTRLNILPNIRPHVAFVTPTFEERKLRKESGRAYLDFPLNEVAIYPEYRHNPKELHKIKRSIDLVKNDTNVVISNIAIHGYASPEGTYSNNARLASERTQTLKRYVCEQYDFPDTLFTVDSTPEDWEGFIRLLNDTIITHRNELLNIAQSKSKPDEKERKIRKRYSKEFDFILKQWFPGLRHSDYTIHYEVRPFTINQAKEVFRTNPKNLSIEEMFRIAQTYPVNSPEYNKVFMTAVSLNPDHPVANLNAACIQVLQGNTTAATSYLEKADDSPEKTLLLGILQMLKGEYREAEKLLLQAKDAGLPQATENLQILYDIY